MLRIYIAGPMTGYPNDNYDLFHRAARHLRTTTNWDVVNPAENFGERHDLPRERYMSLAVQQVATSHVLLLLPGWRQSAGVWVELAVARACGLSVSTLDPKRGWLFQSLPIEELDAHLARPCPRPPTPATAGVASEAAHRKARPVCTGVLDYFPDALQEVAYCSKVGNDQHNPGQPLHWDRSKSTDEADALVRHLLERGTVDSDGVRHSAKVAWRALALLQKEIEKERKEKT